MTVQCCFALLLAGLACQAAAQASDETMPVFGPPMSATALEGERGGTRVTLNEMELAGATTSNTARNVQTGSNVIDGASFANLNGIPVVIQNTGANVLIQNALILNLQMD